MTKPGWCTWFIASDHQLPYQNGLCSLARREHCNCLPWSLVLFLLMRTSASTVRWRWALRCESPIFQVASTWKSNTFLYISTYLLSIGFHSCRQPDLLSVTIRQIHFLFFWDNSILLSTVAVPICIPTNSAKGFPFLHILSRTCWFIGNHKKRTSQE